MHGNFRQSYELQKASGIGTSLHEPAEMGDLDIVPALFAEGTDPSSSGFKDRRGETVLDRAERSNRTVVNVVIGVSSQDGASMHRRLILKLIAGPLRGGMVIMQGI